MPAPRRDYDLSIGDLRETLRYDPETGKFKRLKGRLDKPVGARKPNGYVQLAVKGRIYLAHRLAWFHVYGEWPSEEIDHINGDRADNRLCNLRAASRHQNCGNTRRKNKTGYRGVSEHPRCKGRWMSFINKDGKTVYLGSYGSPEEAAQSYDRAARKHFGQFARTNF